MSASIDTSGIREDIRKAFAGVGLVKVDPNVMSQCVSVATTLHISAEQMAECWEAFSINRNLKTLDERAFASYRMDLIKNSDTVPDVPPGAVVSRPSLSGKRDVDGLPAVTPPAKRFNANLSNNSSSAVDQVGASSVSSSNRRVSLSPAPPTSLSSQSQLPKYNERTNAGKVVHTFNPANLMALETETTSVAAPRCTVSLDFPSNVTQPYRHMFTPIEERARVLDQQLVEMGEIMTERFGLGQSSEESPNDEVAGLEAVGVPRQEKICCIGRICNAAHEGRINATSVLLEGSRHQSGGARVELDLTYLKSTKSSFSLFPGQIVAVEGMNSSGRKMVAHRICEGAAHEPLKSTVKELLHYHHDDACQGGAPLKVMTACGPFTTSDNLEFEPLLDLISSINTDKPDVVILAGPFVDMRQPAIRSGQTTLPFQDGDETLVPFETFFANKVSGLLEDLFAADPDLKTQFVLVPSIDDATAEWVYPQAPFTDRVQAGKNVSIPGAEGIEAGTLGLHHIETAGRSGKGSRRVHCVPNPCTLKINELVIGVTSTDVLFHMSADETNANLEPGSRLGRLAQHMLQQRSYYPLYPAALTMNLDLKRMEQWKMPCQPDILIAPSKLTSFARTVLDSTVVVNPGHLSRDTTGGTYAVLEIHPFKRETLENAGGEDVEVQHAANERTRVEIKRI